MNKIPVLIALVAVTLSGLKTFARDNDPIKDIPAASSNAEAKEPPPSTTYYMIKFKGNPVPTGLVSAMPSAYYVSGTTASFLAPMQGSGTYPSPTPRYIFAGSASCRAAWLGKPIPGGGGQTFSMYYEPAGSFTSDVNYLLLACATMEP